MKFIKRIVLLCSLVLIVPGLTGCWYAAAAGAGAYGGVKAKEAGYSLQNPIKKDAPQKKSDNKEDK